MNFKIGKLEIGKGKTHLIVDIGINHSGSLDKAIYFSDLAIENGAEIIKHQTHIADKEMSIEAKNLKPGNSNQNIFKIINDNSLKLEDEKKLCNYIRNKKKIFISTPFCREAADRLNSFNVPAFKIGSGECNNYPLINYICKFKKPIILSTGMNTMKEVSKSVSIIKKNKVPFAILHCTNIYPTPHELIRLNAMLEIKKMFKGIPYGLSDHSETNFSCYSAISFGASLLEKHFTDDKKSKGPDMTSSMDVVDLRNMLEACEIIPKILPGKKEPVKKEFKTIKFAFASISAIKDIKKGEIFTENNIFPIRPNTGYFKPADLKRLIGKRSKRNIKASTQLKKSDIY